MKYSKRAALFERVLGYINSGDYDASGEFIIFGKEAFERHTGESLEEVFGFEDSLRELLSNAKLKRGKNSVQKRISLKEPPKELTEDELKAWKEFSSRFPGIFEHLVEELSKSPPLFEPVTNPRGASDDRDAALALEAIQWLDQATARLDGLDEVASGVGLDHIEQYFEEAHRCDLAGLKIATAVLCRAVLEGALKQIVDQKRTIENKKQPRDSYIKLMLTAAKEAGKLCDERVQVGLEIMDTGNKAIHDVKKFRARNRGSMTELVDNTRKVLEDLYR